MGKKISKAAMGKADKLIAEAFHCSGGRDNWHADLLALQIQQTSDVAKGIDARLEELGLRRDAGSRAPLQSLILPDDEPTAEEVLAKLWHAGLDAYHGTHLNREVQERAVLGKLRAALDAAGYKLVKEDP